MKNKITVLLGLVAVLLTINFKALAQLSEEVVKRTPELPGEIVVDFGYNLLYNKPSHWDKTHWFRSPSFAVYFTKAFEVSNRFEVRPGIGMSFEKIGSTKNDAFVTGGGDSGSSLSEQMPEGADFKKAKLGLALFEMPIELRFNFGGNDDRTSPFISVAPAIGFNYETKIKYKFSYSGENFKMKMKGDADFLAVNKFRFGIQGRIGWGQFAIFYKHYLTPIFKEDGLDGTGETMMSTVGISITGL